MSYQWDVESCDATNRVIGGSPGSRNQRYTVSSTRPASHARHADTDRVTGGSPAAASTRLMKSHRSTGAPSVMKYAFPAAGEPTSSFSAAHRWAAAALSMNVTLTLS